MGYASDFVKPMPSLAEYFSFSVSMLFAFGLVFELPLFILFLARLGMVSHVSLRKHQKYAVLGSFIVAAVLTPGPDAISQLLMAAPLCLLYEVGIWVAYLFGKRPKKEQTETVQESGRILREGRLTCLSRFGGAMEIRTASITRRTRNIHNREAHA